VTYGILRRFGLADFYDKLLVVPLLNLSVRALDSMAAREPLSRFGRWETAFGLRRLNAIHMGCWGLLFMAMLGTGFVEGPPPGPAIDYWRKAAEEGRPHAAEKLVSNLTILSRGGAGDACVELGRIYAEGRFVPKDPAAAARFFAQAREIYAKASAKGDVAARASLARMELVGEGGPPDLAAARKTMNLTPPSAKPLGP
jgi:hypothetical protein